jgi:superoxide dismutase, Fe-Mn family
MYQLPELPYEFSALEPFISEQIMRLHYTKHHGGYVANLNAALEKYQKAEKDCNLPEMLALQKSLKFNGGGHINHSIFWTILAPCKQGGGELPKGELLNAIVSDFESTERLIEIISNKANTLQGSGWACLGFDKTKKKLVTTTSPNQDPLILQGLIPLLLIDVWEHAYYLQYQNLRAEYIKNIWKIINWHNVEDRFLKART